MSSIEHLSSPDKKGGFQVGEYMTINRSLFMDGKPRELSDGLILRPGDLIGRIHITENLPVLEKNENLIGATRKLYISTVLSLRELAILCQKDNSKVSKLVAFYGISHLAGPLAERLGFDVFKIESKLVRDAHRLAGYAVAHRVGRNNIYWNDTKDYFKPPNEAIISRGKLISLYGKREETEAGSET